MDKLSQRIALRHAQRQDEASISRPGPMAEEHTAVAPPGWEDTVKKMKKHDEVDNPWALAWHMKNKGDTPGGKEGALPEQFEQAEEEGLTPEPAIPESRFPEKENQDSILAAVRVAMRQSISVIAMRVAARYQMAHEFPTPEALRDYLHQHPQADPKNHTVKKPGEHKEPKEPKEPEGGKGEHEEKSEGHGGEHHEKKPKTSWKDMAKNLSAKAKSFLQNAPSEIKKFVTDENHRRDSLMKAHKAITDAPEKLGRQALKAAKHEVKEFKTAGEGVKAMLSGQKMSHEQKHAFKAVAKHMALSVAIGALGAGVGAGAAVVGKGIAATFVNSLAKKVAAKSVQEHLEHAVAAHEFGELAHHGIELFTTIMEKIGAEGEGKPDPEEVLQMMVAAAVAKGLKELDPEMVKSVLEEDSGVSSEG